MRFIGHSASPLWEPLKDALAEFATTGLPMAARAGAAATAAQLFSRGIAREAAEPVVFTASQVAEVFMQIPRALSLSLQAGSWLVQHAAPAIQSAVSWTTPLFRGLADWASPMIHAIAPLWGTWAAPVLGILSGVVAVRHIIDGRDLLGSLNHLRYLSGQTLPDPTSARSPEQPRPDPTSHRSAPPAYTPYVHPSTDAPNSEHGIPHLPFRPYHPQDGDVLQTLHDLTGARNTPDNPGYDGFAHPQGTQRSETSSSSGSSGHTGNSYVGPPIDGLEPLGGTPQHAQPIAFMPDHTPRPQPVPPIQSPITSPPPPQVTPPPPPQVTTPPPPQYTPPAQVLQAVHDLDYVKPTSTGWR